MPRVPLLSILLSAALLLAPAAARADVAPEFFNLPAGNNVQGGIAVDGDGSIWVPSGRVFGDPTIARLVPSQAVAGTANGTAVFPTPRIIGTSCCANIARSVAYEPEKRRVWFVQSDGIIGWADPAQVQPGTSSGMSAVLLRTPLRSGSDWTGDLWDVAAAPSGGNVWFTERSTYNVDPYPGARIAWFNKDVGVPNELSNIALQGGARSLDPLRYDAKPSGIAVGADGQPWFAESDPGNPGWRIATPRGSGGLDYDEYLVTPCAPGSPCSGSFTGTGITDVTVAPDRSIWFTNELRNEFGRLDTVNRTFTSYSLPASVDPAFAGGRPMAIYAAPDGTVWLAQNGGISHPNGNAIVKVVPDPRTPTATVWKLGRSQYPFAVTADAAGSIWFAVNTDSGPGQIGRLAGGGGTPGGGTPGGGTPGGGTPGGGAPGGGTAPGGGAPGGGTAPAGGGPTARPLVPVTVGVARPGTPSGDGDSMRIDQICVGPPEAQCSLVYIISAGEYVAGFPGSRSDDRDRSRAVTAVAAAAKKGRAKPRGRARARAVILGQKVVTLRGGQRATVRVTLNAKGRALLRRAGRLKLFVTVTQRGANGVGRRLKAVRVVFRRPARSTRRR